MTLYEDYESWRKENHDFLLSLIKTQSKSIVRFTQVIAVVDYLFEKQKSIQLDLDADEENIFSVGFDYIYDRILTLKIQYESNFNSDIVMFNQYGKTLNLLLYINDFQDELLNATDSIDKDMDTLNQLEDTVLKALEEHKEVEDGLFVMLDETVTEIFERHNLELSLTEEIFYEIAVHYSIYKEPEEFSFDFAKKNENNN